MSYFKIIVSTLAFLLFTGCGSSIKTVRPNQADLKTYKTFSYLPNAAIDLSNIQEESDELNAFLIETINERMKQAGYVLDRDNPDLLVLVSTATDIETERDTEPVYATYPYGNTIATTPVNSYYQPFYYRGWYNWYNSGGIVGYTSDTYSYEEGVVVIDLVDRETKRSVWKGRTSEPMREQTETQAVMDAINQIFTEYPLIENNN